MLWLIVSLGVVVVALLVWRECGDAEREFRRRCEEDRQFMALVQTLNQSRPGAQIHRLPVAEENHDDAA